jgi:hypothetical protein
MEMSSKSKPGGKFNFAIDVSDDEEGSPKSAKSNEVPEPEMVKPEKAKK